MEYTDQRNRLRAILAASDCVSPASVYDPLSARIAQSQGYELGLLPGPVSTNAIRRAGPQRAYAYRIRRCGAPADLVPKIASTQEMERLLGSDPCMKLQREFLR